MQKLSLATFFLVLSAACGGTIMNPGAPDPVDPDGQNSGADPADAGGSQALPTPTPTTPTPPAETPGGTPAPPAAASKFTLTVNGVNFGGHQGSNAVVLLLDANGGKHGMQQVLLPPAGTFTMAFANEIEAGVAYRLQVYVDVNKDGKCTAPRNSGDHQWTFAVPASTADASARVSHSTAQTDICTSFQ
jgi:hypothetical protein